MSVTLIEQKDKRKQRSKTFRRSDGKTVHHFHTSPIHFENDDGVMEEIDTRFVPITPRRDSFEVTKNATDIRIDKTLSSKSPFVFDNEGLQIGLMPRGLRWADKSIVAQDTLPIDVKVAGSVAVYEKAFGDVGDLVLQSYAGGIKKIVRINDISKAPGGVGFLEVGFEIICPDHAEIWYSDPSTNEAVNAIRAKLKEANILRMKAEADKRYYEARLIYTEQQRMEIQLHDTMLVQWDKKTDVRFQGEYQIRDKDVKTYGRIPRVWDSGSKAQNIDIELRVRNEKLYFVKLIPIEFFINAEFPVFTDTTASYYAGAGDGYSRLTGSAGQSFSTVRNGTSGNDTSYVATNDSIAYTAYLSGTNQYRVARGFYPCDTSGLDDAATIVSAILYFATTGAAGDLDDTSAHIVQTSQASNTQLVNDDYNNLAFTSGGSRTLDSITSSGYWGITLNATGLTWINKTGFTLIGLINSQDLNNTPSPSGNGNSIVSYFSEQTGTGNDPYLEVVTSTAHTKSLNETVTVNDSQSRSIGRSLSEQVTVTDTVSKGFARLFAESMTITDAADVLRIFNIACDEALTVTDTMTKSMSKALSETVAIADSFVREIAKTLTEEISVTDAITWARTTFLSFTENITIVDQTVSFFKRARGFILGRKKNTNTNWGRRKM